MRYAFALFALFLLLAGCNSQVAQTTDLSSRNIRVVSTTGMITDALKNIGGDRLEVHGLMGPGVDPHLHKPSAGDVDRMANADVIFYNGLHLEGQMGEIFERMGKRVKTVAVSKNLDEKKDLRNDEDGAHDPHIWFDVRLWMKCVEAMRDALVELDPKHAATYQANATKYLAELAELDKYVRTEAVKVPKPQRVLITAHDAFYYFGHAYDVEVKGLQGISTAAEASPKDVQALADFIVERKIPAVFIESSVPQKNVEAVQTAVKAKKFDVKIGGELFSDALGDAGTPEGTYVGMVKHNINTMVKALKP